MAEEIEPEIEPEILTEAEIEFLHYRYNEGKSLVDAYKASHPKTRMSRMNCAREGWSMLQRCRKKIGSWQDMMAMHNLGPDRIASLLNEAANTEIYTDVYDEKTGKRKTIMAIDARAKIMVAKELKEIHNLAEQTVNVKVDKPLPLVVIVDKGEDED